ncbi:FkbM family methyltransferase [Rhizobium sp. CRIBSB]|nr:FkbM family methyltransferase [Rhizobium sp. CRIBSB]
MKFFGSHLYQSPVAVDPARAGDQARDRGDWAGAAAAYREYLETSPDRADIWVQLGHALKESGDLAGAEAAYGQALTLAPTVADTHLQLGHLFKMSNRLDEAAENYVRALELAPGLPDARAELRTLMRIGVVVRAPRAREGDGSARRWLQKGPRRRPRVPVLVPRPPLPRGPEPAAPSSAETVTVSAPVPVETQRYFTLAPDLGLTRLTDGHFLYVDPADEAVAAHLIARGYWESWIHGAVRGLIRPGDHTIEVGANFGYYTVAMAQGVGETGSVTTFEANPMLASLVGRSVKFNGYANRVTVVGKAAADRPVTLTFAVSRRNAGGGSISTDPGGLGDGSHLIEVEAVRLDDVCERDVRLIRMDAEGSEPLILAGAVRLLQRQDIVLCMEWDIVQMSARVNMDEFVGWLVDMGFRFWRIQFDSTLIEVPAAGMSTLSACDVVVSRAPPPGGVLATGQG